MAIPIFYNPRQSMERMVTRELAQTLPIVRTPWLVVKAAYNSFRDVTINSDWKPLTAEEISVAHDPQYVADILSCRKSNGFGCLLESAANAHPWESASFYHASAYAVRSKATAMSPAAAFHHAGYMVPMAFCTFNGLMISAILLRQRGLVETVGIIDFDVHYDNGTVDIMEQLGLDFVHRVCLDEMIRGARLTGTTMDEWLAALPGRLEKTFSDVDVIFYQAGADSHVDDPCGGFFTTGQLQQRDQIVFQFAADHHIPVAWNPAGGYQSNVDEIVRIHLNTFRAALSASRRLTS